MTTEAELKRLIARSIADPSQEPDFLRALLTATLYVHLPHKRTNAKLHLVCFTRPDGLTVIPIFSDKKKAARAAQGAVAIGALTGRDLFISAPGATFMLDPNDDSTTLYPEEIVALMNDGAASSAQRFTTDAPMALSAALAEDLWLGELIAEAVKTIESVAAVYFVQTHYAESTEATGLLACVVVPSALAERAARAAALVIGGCEQQPRLPVDLATYDPTDPSDWVVLAELEPVWERHPASAH